MGPRKVRHAERLSLPNCHLGPAPRPVSLPMSEVTAVCSPQHLPRDRPVSVSLCYQPAAFTERQTCVCFSLLPVLVPLQGVPLRGRKTNKAHRALISSSCCANWRLWGFAHFLNFVAGWLSKPAIQNKVRAPVFSSSEAAAFPWFVTDGFPIPGGSVSLLS